MSTQACKGGAEHNESGLMNAALGVKTGQSLVQEGRRAGKQKGIGGTQQGAQSALLGEGGVEGTSREGVFRAAVTRAESWRWRQDGEGSF